MSLNFTDKLALKNTKQHVPALRSSICQYLFFNQFFEFKLFKVQLCHVTINI